MYRLLLMALLFISMKSMAYYPALRNVTAQINGSGYVQCSVVDPQTGSTVNYTGSTNQSVTQLISLNGVIAYTSGTGFSRYLHAVTYDPYTKNFVAFSYGISNSTVPQLIVRDGMVAGYFTSGTFSGSFFALTYDPADQGNQWQFYQYGMSTNAVTHFACAEGVAVIAFESGFQSNTVFGVMYDPIQQSWEIFNRSVYPVTTLQIADATAYFTTSSGSYYYGYNASSRDWYNGQTSTLLCKFYAAKASGFDARYCWVTDQSFGATSWFIDFGDGASAALRSMNHQYNSVSRYGITATISNNSGSSINCTDSFASGNISVEEQWLLSTTVFCSENVLHLRDLPSGFDWQLELVDTKGAIAFRENLLNQQRADIYLREELNGIYFVRLINQDGSSFSKKIYLQ